MFFMPPPSKNRAACYAVPMGILLVIVFFALFLAFVAVAPQAFMQITLGLVWLMMFGAVLYSIGHAVVRAFT